MKPSAIRPLLLATATASTAAAADLYWDGGTANIGTNGNGVSTYTGGTWSTALANWDAGAVPHVAWNNANLDTAIFAGTYSTGTKTVTIGSDITVNQIKINTGSTGGNRYEIGASSTQNDFAITFSGTYGDSAPAIDGSVGAFNNNFNAKIVGDLTASGGLVIKAASNIATPGTSGRFALTNANNTFKGDLVMLGGNLSVGTQMGDAANKLVLKGGALFMSGGAAATSTWARNIEVAAASGLATNATVAGLQTLDITGTVSGSSNLTRYSNVSGTTTVSEVRFSGDMSGYTGTFENTGTGVNALVTIQTTATSGGAWKLSGGTVKLGTTDDTHIANGSGKSDLLMNGGTLDLNGRNETINGLSGATGTVQNQSPATTATLTLGDGDASATFGGTIRNNSGTGGTVALTKTGGGIQTLSGTNSYTGDTLVSAGTLLVNGWLGATAVTVADNARIGGDGTIGGSVHFAAGADFMFSTTQTLTINGAAVTFAGFSMADVAGLDSSAPDGVYPLIDGSATVSAANLANVGIENSYALGNNKFAYFEIGSLSVHVIPEPATAAFGALGLLALLRRRRA